ncbi:MAG: 2-C-methyl-D-erythritol 4-phosphate cytidylyltransferase [Gammaproteobacteria bacterium]|nr:2-C-methyl-D-erythritol 4-phosphate cytidylyltransferase [Gammaproteobacteria bacterium]
MTDSLSYWAIVPAAGIGKRMGAAIPKQYLSLAGKTVLDVTLGRLLDHPDIEGIVIAISSSDEWWPDSGYASHPNVIKADGGKERRDSVLNALIRLQSDVDNETRVLVHDAARPCVRQEDISKLIQSAGHSDDGGLLGMPVRDTMKRTTVDRQVSATVERDNLWHAFTPQLFRLDLLRRALHSALESGRPVTDEASAMELLGYKPLMVEGKADNLKITRPEDLSLAEYFLNNQ